MGRARKSLRAFGLRQSSASPVASIAKALAALKAFVDGQEHWGVRELAAALSEPPSTVHRILTCLHVDGFVRYDRERQKYSIGLEFARLSAAVINRNGLLQAAWPLLHQLATNRGAIARLAAYDENACRIVHIAEHDAAQSAITDSVVGRAAALTETAFGLAVLAALTPKERTAALAAYRGNREALRLRIEDNERIGYSIVRSTEPSVPAAIAAAVRDATGRPVGSIGVVFADHLDAGSETSLAGQVRNTAAWLSQKLGAKILGGASVGSWHDAITLISELLSHDASGPSMMPASGGGASNLQDLASGLGAYALSTGSSLHDAWQGRLPFQRRHNELRTVINLSDLQLFIIAHKDLAGDSLASLLRLRVSPGEQGYSAAQLFDRLLTLVPNVRRQRRRVSGETLYFDYPEGKRQFLARNVDVLFWLTNPSNAALQELASTDMARLHCLDAALLKELVCRNPGCRVGHISHARYPRWLTADAQTLVVPTVLCCRADQPEDEVYAVARSIYRHSVQLGEQAPIADLSANLGLEDFAAPPHLGTARLLRERGALTAPSNGRERTKTSRHSVHRRTGAGAR